MQEWMAVCRDIRSDSLLPIYAAWLADVYGEVGRPAEGLALVNEALAAERLSGHPYYWTAEMHRLKGALTLQSAILAGARPDGHRDRLGRADRRSKVSAAGKEAEACFLDAVAIARRQRAKSFELRAATSLARLWTSQGNTRDAHTLLAGVYAWFTEGFDTPDLREAQALLQRLEHAG